MSDANAPPLLTASRTPETSRVREGWLRLDDTDQQGGTLSFGGEWTLATATELDGRTRAMDPQTVTAVDLSAITRMDTAGAWLIHRTIAEIRGAGREVVATGLPERFGSLFDDVGRADLPDQLEERGPTWLTDMVLRVGEASFGLFREGRRLLSFYGMLLVKGGRLVVQPHRLRLTSLVHHLEQTGLYAVPIVALLSFLIGIVLAYQGADQLRRFGAELLTVNLLGLSILRELGALMTAIIVAGRSGSAFTAQIGTMKVNQEVDALETLGLDPVDILVLPRILALMVALPALTFLSDLVGIIGGGLMSWAVLDIPPDAFARQFREAVPINHLWVGLMKAPVFAFIIGMVGCYEGLKVTGSAESVGAQTTRAVVEAIFLVIVVDAGFSILFSTVGI